ncbi:unnamed protein product, partial [Effrenium voratum]
RGKLFKASERHRQALAGREDQLGAIHLETLGSAQQLAKVLQDQGRLSEAEDFYRRALQGQEELGHVSALSACCDLAQFFRSAGKLAKAKSVVENLAGQLQNLGKLAEVDELYRRAIQRSEEQLGATHPSTLALVSHLAVLLQEQGKTTEAEFLQRQALRGHEKVLGPSHPETLLAMSHLGQLCALRGNLAEGEKLLGRALSGLEEQLDASHPHTLRAVDHMGCLLQAQGRRAEAEKFFKRALRGREKLQGPETSESLEHLAVFMQDHPTEAEALWRRLVPGGSGANDQGASPAPPALRAAKGLARNLRAQNKPEAAAAARDFAARLQEQGACAAAEKLLREVQAECREQLGEQHPSTL